MHFRDHSEQSSQPHTPSPRRRERRKGLCRWAAGPGTLTAMHCLMMQDCFILPGPPNFFMSLQKWHSPHSVRRHASHLRHRVLRRRAPAVLRLAASFTAEAAPSFPLGRPTALFWKRQHTQRVSCMSQLPAEPCGENWMVLVELHTHRNISLLRHKGVPLFLQERMCCKKTQKPGHKWEIPKPEQAHFNRKAGRRHRAQHKTKSQARCLA